MSVKMCGKNEKGRRTIIMQSDNVYVHGSTSRDRHDYLLTCAIRCRESGVLGADLGYAEDLSKSFDSQHWFERR